MRTAAVCLVVWAATCGDDSPQSPVTPTNPVAPTTSGFMLSGAVRDSRPNGPALAGATVRLDNGQSTAADPEGRYKSPKERKPMTTSSLDMSSETGPALPPIVPGKLILNGENPFIRLSNAPGDPFTTDASLWTITYSPKGAGHALFIRSELTDDQWRIYSDNPEMVSWLQATVQGMLNPETASSRIAVLKARFSRHGDVQSSWTQRVRSDIDDIVLVWSNLIGPLLMAHDQPTQLPEREYGVSVVMIPALEAGLILNGRKASGQVWPCKYDGQPFSTASLAFSETWRES